MKRLLIGLIILGFLVGSVSAWTIVDSKNRVAGSVDFYGDKTGIVNITDGPVINFTWYQSGDMIRANYLFYGIDIYYNASTGELYSPGINNVTLKRV